MATTTPDHARDDGASDRPTELPRRVWWAVLKRTLKEFREDDITDWAAALTYYAVLSIFPAMIVLVSVLGMIGESATDPILENLADTTPGPARDIVTSAIENIQASPGTAGVLFAFGVATALWSASGYIGAFTRAVNAIYEVEEGRPFWKLRPTQLGITAIMLVLVALLAGAVVFTGPLAEEAGNLVGVGGAALTVWDIAKWPVIILAVMAMFAFLYWVAPNVKHPSFRWVSPGGVVGMTLWLAASLGFAFYVSNFGSYNETYGSLGGVIAFLVWLWITNLAILFGAELNAEAERARQIELGLAPDREPFLPPKAEPKSD